MGTGNSQAAGHAPSATSRCGAEPDVVSRPALHCRNQGAILEARHQLAKADDEKRSAVTRLSSELNDAYQTVARTSNEIYVLKKSVLPGAEKAVEAIRQGYEAGRFSYLDVNEGRRTLTAARLQYLQALSDYHKAVAEIEALTVQPFDAKSGFSK